MAMDNKTDNSFFSFSSGEISVDTQSGRRILVNDVSFSIEKGESCSLIGETGSGKTMIAMAIMGMQPKNIEVKGNRCILDGVDISAPLISSSLLGLDIAYIPQNGMEFLNPKRKVKGHIEDSLKRSGYIKSELKDKEREILSSVGFKDVEKVLESYPFQLSGGMAQRVTIALALCTRAKLIIADEPTNGLDKMAANRMLSHLYSLFPDASKLIITHDISVASRCDKLLVLCGGRSMEKGPVGILSSPRSSYTKSLLSALGSNGMKASPYLREKNICPFSDRCPDYCSGCLKEISKKRDGEHEWWCAK